jgi:hypothetical protein
MPDDPLPVYDPEEGELVHWEVLVLNNSGRESQRTNKSADMLGANENIRSTTGDGRMPFCVISSTRVMK